MSRTGSDPEHIGNIALIHIEATTCPDMNDMALLSPMERARMMAYRDVSRAARFCAARAALRRVLAQRIQCTPQRVPLMQTVHGKPYVAGVPQLCFSVSYDTNRAFIAVCEGREIGLDVQRLTARRIETVRNFILRGEGNADAVADPARIWTRMEAYGKMAGVGLLAGPEFLLDVALCRAVSALPHGFLDLDVRDAAASICLGAVT